MAGPRAKTSAPGRSRSRGASSIEYALLVVAIAGVIATVIFALSQPIEDAFRGLIDQWNSQSTPGNGGGSGSGGSGGGTGGGGGSGGGSASPSASPSGTPSPSATP